MGYGTVLKMAYIFGELEADFKRLQKKNWLNENDLTLVTKEFNEIKAIYTRLDKEFNPEEAEGLIDRMKKMDIDPFLAKKENFLVRFDKWKNSLEGE